MADNRIFKGDSRIGNFFRKTYGTGLQGVAKGVVTPLRDIKRQFELLSGDDKQVLLTTDSNVESYLLVTEFRRNN